MTSEEIINALIEGCDEIDTEERRADLEQLRDAAHREGARDALQGAAAQALAESADYNRLADEDGGPNVCEYEAMSGEWLHVAVWLSLGAAWADQGTGGEP